MPWLYRTYNYGPLTTDIASNFEATAIYELPFGKGKHWVTSGKAANIFGGWQLSGLFSDFSGRPFSVVANNNLNANGSFQFANCIAAPQQVGTLLQWYDPVHLRSAGGYLFRELRPGFLERSRADQRRRGHRKEVCI